MTVLKNAEASRPGEALESKMNDEFHNEDIRVLDSSKADTSSVHNTAEQSKASNQYNALLITPSEGAKNALWALKDELGECGSRYSKTPPYFGWIAPLVSKKLVEELLTKKGVKFSVKLIWDEYQEKNKFARSANHTWERIDILEKQLIEGEHRLLVEERKLEDEILKSGLEQSEPIVLDKYRQIENKMENLQALREEIAQLRNSAKICETKANEECSDDEKLPSGFYFDGDSLMFQRQQSSKDKEIPSPSRLCQKLEVKAVVRDKNGHNFGRLLEFRDCDGIKKQWALPMELLAGNGDEYRRILLDRGLEISSSKSDRVLLSEYLNTHKPRKRMRSVSSTGWHDKCFVMPDEIFGNDEKEEVVLQTKTTHSNTYSVNGTLDEWQQQIALICKGNTRLIFSLNIAFAGPLIHLLAGEPGGFHFCGSTSQGKTTAQRVATSVWGGRDFMRSWRSTINGLEGIAILHNDTLLVIDEIGQCEPHEVGNCAYMLANGIGKGRATQNGLAKDPFIWRIVFLSSGEIGLAQHMDEVGKKMKGGQEVRLLEISSQAGQYGMFETLHGFHNGRDFAENLIEKCQKYYGTAGRAFLTSLMKHLEETIHTAREMLRGFIKQNEPKGADRLVGRALTRFALVGVAGEIASRFGVIPFENGICLEAALKCFHSWLDMRGGVQSHEEKEIVAQVKRFFEQHGESRFSLWDEEPNDSKTQNRVGFRKFESGETEYYVFPQAFNSDIAKGFDPQQVSKICIKQGFLKEGKDRTQCPVRLPGKSKTARCYVFTSKVLGDEE